jgi:hypothetical protein
MRIPFRARRSPATVAKTLKGMINPMRESDVEQYLVDRVKHLGGEVRKVKWIGRDGAPDRAIFLGGVHFVEVKAPGKTPEPHQEREHQRMKKHGIKVWVVDSYRAVDEMFKWLGWFTAEEFRA